MRLPRLTLVTGLPRLFVPNRKGVAVDACVRTAGLGAGHRPPLKSLAVQAEAHSCWGSLTEF